MKTESRYVILNVFGRAWTVSNRTLEPVNLADLLLDGWRPIRETPFAATDRADSAQSVLILLEREVEGSFGFGFRPA